MPEKFCEVLGHQFIAELDDKGKIDLVQVYLEADKTKVTYTEAKQAVSKAYRRFSEPSPLDQLHGQPISPSQCNQSWSRYYKLFGFHKHRCQGIMHIIDKITPPEISRAAQPFIGVSCLDWRAKNPENSS